LIGVMVSLVLSYACSSLGSPISNCKVEYQRGEQEGSSTDKELPSKEYGKASIEDSKEE